MVIRNEIIYFEIIFSGLFNRADHVNKITISARKWPEKWGFFDSKKEHVS
jgi:hypothetical protein